MFLEELVFVTASLVLETEVILSLAQLLEKLLLLHDILPQSGQSVLKRLNSLLVFLVLCAALLVLRLEDTHLLHHLRAVVHYLVSVLNHALVDLVR